MSHTMIIDDLENFLADMGIFPDVCGVLVAQEQWSIVIRVGDFDVYV